MTSPPGHRRPILFRSVLLVVLIGAALAAWRGYRMRNDRLQNDLVESIGRKGGYAWLDVTGPYVDIEFRPSPFGRACGQVRCLASPDGTDGTFTDNDIALVAKLKYLRSGGFTNTKVSKIAIARLQLLRPQCRVEPSP